MRPHILAHRSLPWFSSTAAPASPTLITEEETRVSRVAKALH